MLKLLVRGPHSERERCKTLKTALLAQRYYYCYDHGCYCSLAFSNPHLRRLGIPASWPLQGPVVFLESPPVPPHDLCTCAGQQLGRRGGGCSAQLLQA